MQRKPGGYRQPTQLQRELSRISKSEYEEWFQQIWRLTGASTKEHPAPFPVDLAYRLVRMFSFVGDTVLDPFCGTGSTIMASARCGRNSIGIEIDRDYCQQSANRISAELQDLYSAAEFRFVSAEQFTASHSSEHFPHQGLSQQIPA